MWANKRKHTDIYERSSDIATVQIIYLLLIHDKENMQLNKTYHYTINNSQERESSRRPSAKI